MRANSEQISHLLKTARGQIDRLLAMVEEDAYCIDISNQLFATERLLKKANREVLHAHLEGCVMEAVEKDNHAEKIEEIMDVVDKITR